MAIVVVTLSIESAVSFGMLDLTVSFSVMQASHWGILFSNIENAVQIALPKSSIVAFDTVPPIGELPSDH